MDISKEFVETATLGGGCFWCTEAQLLELDGVISVESGYSGGHVLNPSYREVCMGITGHAEVVQVRFDKRKLSYYDILFAFFISHDPTQLNRQGNDVGTQYRSVIFYHSEEQHQQAQGIINEFTEKKIFDAPIVTEVSAFTNFYKAEDYHQNYYSNNPEQPYCYYVIGPKMEKFRKVFAGKLKVDKK